MQTHSAMHLKEKFFLNLMKYEKLIKKNNIILIL